MSCLKSTFFILSYQLHCCWLEVGWRQPLSRAHPFHRGELMGYDHDHGRGGGGWDPEPGTYMICSYLCIRILQDMIWMSAYSLLALLKFTIPSMLSWDTSIYTSKPWPFPNKEPPVNGLPGGAPRRLCATVGMVGRAVGAVGSVRVGIVRVGSDGMLSVGSRTWSTSSQGGNGAALVASVEWRSRICVWVSYFSYISWRVLLLTLVIDGSYQLLKCVTRVLWTYQYWRSWGAQCKSTLWIHRSTSIHDSWWRNEKQSIQLSSCSTLVHIQLI